MDAYRLFEVKQKFLREIPHPLLIEQQLKRLDTAPVQKHPTVDVQLEGTLENSLSTYLDKLMPLKLAISNAPSVRSLVVHLTQLYQLHRAMIERLATYCPPVEERELEAIKISPPFDAYAILTFLKTKAIDDSEIKPYLCYALTVVDRTRDSVLTTSVLRAKKIMSRGGSLRQAEKTT